MLSSGQRQFSSKKLPFRLSKTPRQSNALLHPQKLLIQKYLSASVNAFYFRQSHTYLQVRPLARELSYLISRQECLGKYYTFEEIKINIRGIVIERVEKDYMFGLTFHAEWRLLEKYVHLQKKVRQRNLYNRYYFSDCPPKLSHVTQITATTVSCKPPETNSTLELKSLTQDIDIMISTKNVQNPEKRIKKYNSGQKKHKSKSKIKMNDTPVQSYGLKNYKKERNRKARGSQPKVTKINCITPQPHMQKHHDYGLRASFFLTPRLSQRSLHSKSKSNKKKSKKSKGY